MELMVLFYNPTLKFIDQLTIETRITRMYFTVHLYTSIIIVNFLSFEK